MRLQYVAGVSPAKWLRAWAERRPDLPLEAEHGMKDARGHVREIDSSFHDVCLPPTR